MVASILGISTFALQLTKTLYEFGDAVESAKEETDKIARNLSNCSNVLDLLQESLRDDEPLYTQKALNLAHSLSKQSETIFEEIRAIVPGSPPWDGLKLREKAQWAFRKSKVNGLVAEIEHLKSTLNLLLQTMILNRQNFLTPDKDKRYTTRAELALYEQVKAAQLLRTLQTREKKNEQLNDNEARSSSSVSVKETRILDRDSVLSDLESEYTRPDTSTNDGVPRLREESLRWLNRMKAEWFNAEAADSHLSLQLVIRTPESSSSSRGGHTSRPEGKHEERTSGTGIDYRELERLEGQIRHHIIAAPESAPEEEKKGDLRRRARYEELEAEWSEAMRVGLELEWEWEKEDQGNQADRLNSQIKDKIGISRQSHETDLAMVHLIRARLENVEASNSLVRTHYEFLQAKYNGSRKRIRENPAQLDEAEATY